MFHWLRRKPLSARRFTAANPGRGPVATLAVSTGGRSWTEEVDTVDSLARVLTGLGHSVTRDGAARVRHPDSGLVFRPQFVALHPLDNGAVRTVTTVETTHPELAPDGVFEFQHSVGGGPRDAIDKGFDQWAGMDLVTFREALRARPEACTMLQMSFPGQAGQPARFRRAILGPVGHYVENPPDPPAAGAGDEHPFCPCCLLTRSIEAFKDLFQGDGFYAIRRFAARDPDGTPEADCRVNGAAYAAGARALKTYARTWPRAGYEFRKQYVILQTTPDPEGQPA